MQRAFKIILVTGMIVIGSIAGWFYYLNQNYVASNYASVEAPYAWLTNRTSGVVTRVAVVTGQLVKKGQLIATVRTGAGVKNLYSPSTGRIGSLNITSGSAVSPTVKNGVVVDTAHERIIAQIPMHRIAHVSLGDLVHVRLTQHPGHSYTGYVTHIGPTSLAKTSPILSPSTFSKQRVWIPITIRLSSPVHMYAGETATVRVVI